MAPRRRSLTEADQAEWTTYARLLRPMPGRHAPSLPDMPPPPSAPAPASRMMQAAPHTPPPLATGLSVGHQPGGLDNSSWNRFRSGKLPSMRTLDLHGRTAQRAFHALHHFLHSAHADHVRCVEVITGRGQGEHGGILRRELPLWLNLPALRPLVLAATYPHPSNPGAVRLLLRRPR